ncbi:uncharacterized protein LOC131655687 [Vicia villosa]|uniref:uncharacterized protein LOC131655687 n=1 Tax=Vicia villosa TaxID=3911 RepID=UPI00273B0661|nr:uncharacterized protein LOC131655687 [Vicia villosa]
MGCCISKCKPNKNSLDQFNKHLQDKLVISHQHHQPLPPHSPTTPTLAYPSNKISLSPLSPPSPTSSVSSFTCTTSSNTISSSSSNSLSSLTSKDRSFSNEYLWSCYKENPHIITRINSLSESSPLSFIPTKPKKIVNPSPTKENMPQKRVRSNSPTNLTRQKSFRKEVELLPMRPNRMTGSPSPSRRFTISDNSVSKRISNTNNSPNVSVAHYSRSVNSSSSIRKEGLKATISSPNPNNSLRRIHSSGLNFRQRETIVKDVVASHNHNVDSTVMEDVDNPLISLDCFIFL